MIQLSLTPREHEWSRSLGAPSGAWISDCGTYRTLLWRTFAIGGDAAPLVFGCLNPSKADARINDPSVTRMLGFAHREGAGGIIVTNLSPYRATDPRDLVAAHRAGVDVIYETENLRALETARSFGPFVLAWGASIPPWMDQQARTMLRIGGRGALCLGWTKMGEPRHPLFVRRNQPLVPYLRGGAA